MVCRGMALNLVNNQKLNGVVLFKCGCKIRLKNLAKSKIKNAFRCLFHKTPIEHIFKTCNLSGCDNMIKFRNIKQIINQGYCSRECANLAYKQMVELEDAGIQIFKRNTDCTHYDYCCTVAGLNNIRWLNCEDCRFYILKQKDHEVLSYVDQLNF